MEKENCLGCITRPFVEIVDSQAGIFMVGAKLDWAGWQCHVLWEEVETNKRLEPTFGCPEY